MVQKVKAQEKNTSKTISNNTPGDKDGPKLDKNKNTTQNTPKGASTTFALAEDPRDAPISRSYIPLWFPRSTTATLSKTFSTFKHTSGRFKQDLWKLPNHIAPGTRPGAWWEFLFYSNRCGPLWERTSDESFHFILEMFGGFSRMKGIFRTPYPDLQESWKKFHFLLCLALEGSVRGEKGFFIFHWVLLD